MAFYIIILFSTHYSKDTGHKWFLEDAFQNEYRMYPGGKWLPTTDSPWTDIVSSPLILYNVFVRLKPVPKTWLIFMLKICISGKISGIWRLIRIFLSLSVKNSITLHCLNLIVL